MKPHEQRVIDENTALVEKIVKLRAFTQTATYEALDKEDQTLLRLQLSAMLMYSDILCARQDRFTP